MKKPSFVMFLFMVWLGVVVGLFTSSMTGVWVGMELSFFGFIPIMLGNSLGEMESSVKYFIVQSLSSIMLLFGVVGMMLYSGNLEVCKGLMVPVIYFAISLKVGLFPFHYWVPSVMSSVSWLSCFILGVWQKFLPLFLLSGLGLGFNTTGFFFLMTALIGSVGGLNQVYLRPLLAYSSLVHLGWMSSLCVVSSVAFIKYFIIYMILMVCVTLSLSLVGLSVSSLKLFRTENYGFVVLLGVSFVAVAGLPPTMGFYMKMTGVLVMLNFSLVSVGVLILSSIVSLYYYMGVFFNLLMELGTVSGMGFNLYKLNIEFKKVLVLVMTLMLSGIPFMMGVSL